MTELPGNLPADLPLRLSRPPSEDSPVELTFTEEWSKDSPPRLSIAGVAVDPRLRGGSLCWSWNPDFYCGEIEIALEWRGTRRSCRLVIDPDRAKMTREDFKALVAAIEARSRRLFTVSPTDWKAGLDDRRLPLKLAQLEYLRNVFEDLSRAVRAVAAAPRKRLVDRLVSVPLAHADSVAPDALVEMLGGDNLRRVSPRGVWRALARLANGLGGFLPAYVPIHEEVVTYDLPENRFVKWLLETISSLLAEIHRDLETQATRPRVRNYMRGIERIRREMFDLLRLPFLHDVKSECVRPGEHIVFKRQPHYRRIYDIYRRLFGKVRFSAPDLLKLSLDKTHRLYELWVTLEIAAALIQEHQETVDARDFHEWAFEDISLRPGAERFVELPMSKSMPLFIQNEFGRYETAEGARIGSYSHAMRPDIAIRIDTPGAPSRLLIFDPKYQKPDALADALNDLHRHKDALVDQGLRRAVIGAYALAPRIGPRFLEFATPVWQDRHDFGVIAAHPADPSWVQRVLEIVARAISSSGSSPAPRAPSSSS